MTAQAKFVASSMKSPCPVCGRGGAGSEKRDGDCRSAESGNLVLCHSHSSDPKELINGYKFISPSKDGLWGVFIWNKPNEQGKVKGRKLPRQQRRQEYFYSDRAGNQLVKVERVQKGEDKSFYQYHWDGSQWVPGVPDRIRTQIPVYRYQEVQAAIESGQSIFVVEGENTADALWAIGIPATTTIGGSKKYRSYGNYKQDLEGASVVLCPDRDKVGVEHMEDIAKDFPNAQWCKVYPKSPVWNHLPDAAGLDAEDWIGDGATVDELIQGIVPSLDFDDKSVRSNIEERARRLKLEFQAYLKEPDPVKRLIMRNDICANYRVSKQDFTDQIADLEEANNPKQQSKFDGFSFFSGTTEAIDYYVSRYLPVGEAILLCSDPGVGKSALITDMIHASLSGGEFLGEKVKHAGRVLVISSDESPRSTRRRFIARGIDLLDLSRLDVWTRLDITRLDDLERYLEDKRPDVVFIDSITTVCLNVGISEKDPEFARYLYNLKNLVNRYGSSLVVIHHANKDPLAKGLRRISGSARIPAAFWGVYLLESVDPKNPDMPDRFLEMVKGREVETFKSKITFHQRHEWQEKGIFSIVDESGKEQEYRTRANQIIEVLKQHSPNGLEYREISTAIGLHGNYLYKVLDRLEDCRVVGRRRSATDKRRWVYFLPDNTPSPLPPVVTNNFEPVIEPEEEYIFDEAEESSGLSATTDTHPLTENYSSLHRDSERGCVETDRHQHKKGDAKPNRRVRGQTLLPDARLVVEAQQSPEEFDVGDRVIITADNFDDYERKAVLKEQGDRIGQHGVIEKINPPLFGTSSTYEILLDSGVCVELTASYLEPEF